MVQLILLSVGLIVLFSILILSIYAIHLQKDLHKSISDIQKDYTEKIIQCNTDIKALLESQKSILLNCQENITTQSKLVTDELENLSDTVDDYNEEVSKRIEFINNSIHELVDKQERHSVQYVYALLAGMEEAKYREDVISDKETHNTLVNSYRKGRLIKSTITNAKGNVIFEIVYDSNGEIETSISYDEKGNKKVQQFFEEGKLIKRQTFHGDKIDLNTFA